MPPVSDRVPGREGVQKWGVEEVCVGGGGVHLAVDEPDILLSRREPFSFSLTHLGSDGGVAFEISYSSSPMNNF